MLASCTPLPNSRLAPDVVPIVRVAIHEEPNCSLLLLREISYPHLYQRCPRSPSFDRTGLLIAGRWRWRSRCESLVCPGVVLEGTSPIGGAGKRYTLLPIIL